LYNVAWSVDLLKRVDLSVEVAPVRVAPASGSFIEAARMHVDLASDGLRATTDGGAQMLGRFSADGETWHMTADPALIENERWSDIEDLLTLVLTTGWRRAGWVPLHGGGLLEPEKTAPSTPRGVLVCAASGGGKTTFTIAMVRRGWRSLGDDKLLLRAEAEPGAPTVASVKQMLNIDPAAAAWFPELQGIESEPAYSVWTPKRRVSLGRIWKHAPATTMTPTHLVVVSRKQGRGGIDVSPLSQAEAISALLHQTVIPSDAAVARPITTAVVRLAEGLRGFRLDLFEDAFADSTALDDAERALA
jgi:hypothetical protein